LNATIASSSVTATAALAYGYQPDNRQAIGKSRPFCRLPRVKPGLQYPDMRVAGLFLAGCALLAVQARAQLAVELSLNQDQHLQGEAVWVTVHISNDSGRVLELGQAEDWLTFAIESKDGLPVARLGKLPLEKKITIESAQIARVRLDLEPYYNLSKLGNYVVSASLKVPQWQQQVSSRPAAFNVIHGTTLWEQEFGVPVSQLEATNRPPEMRKYSLLQANYRKQLQLYARVSDPSGEKIYVTFPIGNLVSFGEPERQIDRFSNLHVLHQNGARAYNYVVINPSGRLGIRETYDITTNRPRLKADADGKIFVSGGMRRVTPTDLPSPTTESPTNAPPVPKS
jgi:hypothetical protein